jgi:hypothetical protein
MPKPKKKTKKSSASSSKNKKKLKKSSRPAKKSAPKKAKTSSRPKKEVMSEESVLKLIEKGKHRGFVTQTEIINSFPNLESDISGLESL